MTVANVERQALHVPLRSPPTTTQLLQLALTLLVAFYMLFAGGTFNATLNFRVQLLNTIAAGVLGLAWLALRIARRARLAPTGLELVLFGFVASQWIATLFSAQPRLSLDWTVGVTAWSAIFLIICDLLRNGWRRDYVLIALILLGFCFAAEAIRESASWFATWRTLGVLPPVAFRLTGLGGQANLTSVVLNALLPLVLVQAWGAPRWLGRILLGLLAAAMLVAQFFTSSRAGWLSCAAGLTVLAGLLALTPGAASQMRHRVDYFRRRPGWLQAAAILTFLAAAALGAWMLLLQSEHITHGPLLSSREQFWTVAWTLFSDHPLFGSGPDLYAWHYPRYVSIPNGWFAPHAHSLVLQILAGSGLLGGAAFLALIVGTVLRLAQSWQVNHDKLILAALIAGLAGVAVHNLFDFVLVTPFSISVVLVLLALAVTGAATPEPRQSTYPALLGPVVLVPLALSAWWMGATAQHEAGLKLSASNDWAAAADSFEQAAMLDPGMTLYWQEAAYANTRAGEFDLALTHWRRAAIDDPYWALLPATVGVLAQDRASLAAAAQLAPSSDLFALNIGALEEATGQPVEAGAWFVRALDLNPGISQALFWRQSVVRQSALQEWQTKRGSARPAIEAAGLALQGGDAAQAMKLYRTAVTQDPANVAAYAGLARAYWRLGNEVEAERTLNIGLELPAATPQQSQPLRLVFGDWQAAHGDRAGAISTYVGVFSAINQYTVAGPGTYGYPNRAWTVFHRATLPADVVPQFATADITAEMDAAFVQLARWYREEGKLEIACLVLERVWREAPVSESGAVRALWCG